MSKILLSKLNDQSWRLSNLYYIVNEDGERVLFKPKWSQQHFLDNLHYRNVILKARQVGMTTFIALYMLDTAIFHPDTSCGVIAHTLKDAQNIFQSKIKYPYDNLPDAIKQMVRADNSNKTELLFSNNSQIRVGTSLRSSTLQYLHVSEFGKICAKYPDHAREIVTGAFPTVASDGFIFVESTAEGQSGRFFNMCEEARSLDNKGKKPSPAAFKFHFFPWWRDEKYQSNPIGVEVSPEANTYFENLAAEHSIQLTPEQRAWWIENEKHYAEDMLREFPAHPDEAFKSAIEGAYYGKYITRAEQDGRVGRVPYDPRYEVEVWWDLGLSDDMVMIFAQRTNTGAIHIIDFYANHDYGFAHYANHLFEKSRELGYRYSRHVMPHDITTRSLTAEAKDRKTMAEEVGIKPISIAPKSDVASGIEAARSMLSKCYFDEVKTKALLVSLKHYRREWDEKLATWSNRPRHDEHSHAADAFRYGAMAPEIVNTGFDMEIKVRKFGSV